MSLASCSKKEEEHPGAPPEKPAESRVKHGTNDEIIITLDIETQKTMGLECAPIKEAQLPQSIKAFGRVLDGTQFATQFSEFAAAAATSEASQKEVQRLKTLAEQNNASQRALQTAEASAARDQAQVQAARLRLVGAWGQSLANRPDLPVLVQSLTSLSNKLVQLTLPGSQSLAAPPSGARVVASLSSNATPVEAEFAGIAPLVDPQLQGQQLLFIVGSNALTLIPGAPVTGYVSLSGETRTGVLLPRNAIVRYNGATWVYRQTSDKTFERVEAPLIEPMPDGWFSGPPLKAQDKLVVTAAQLLLSEELKGQTAE